MTEKKSKLFDRNQRKRCKNKNKFNFFGRKGKNLSFLVWKETRTLPMMTDFQPPPIFAVQSLGKQQQHHSDRKSVRFRHRNFGVCFALAVYTIPWPLSLYVLFMYGGKLEILWVKDWDRWTRKREPRHTLEKFLSVVRVRAKHSVCNDIRIAYAFGFCYGLCALLLCAHKTTWETRIHPASI